MKDKNLTEGIRQAHEMLMMCPDCLDVVVGGGRGYSYVNPSKEAHKVRKEVRKSLLTTWGGGAYSYADFSSMLRVDELGIKTALDEDFREEYSLE
jgi:hypothetical protein